MVGLAALSSACGTDANSVAECRAIEGARCRAAAGCGYAEVEACELFARDHCLHGLIPDQAEPVEVEACVSELERAGECASATGLAATASACGLTLEGADTTVCEIISRPELSSRCAFLAELPTEPPAEVVTDADAGT